jgi:hypothetical protein
MFEGKRLDSSVFFYFLIKLSLVINTNSEVIFMGKWNEQAAANNNLPSKTIRSSELLLGNKAEHEFSEELSDGGERDRFIKGQSNKK